MTTTKGEGTAELAAVAVNDVNLLILTDTHSWIGRQRMKHDPYYDADYGDVLSFYERLRDKIQDRGGNLFFVMNGDFTDGTGLSFAPPDHLFPVVETMPFDAVNSGNHEVYHNETTEYILENKNEENHWKTNFITSNVLQTKTKTDDNKHRKTMEPFGKLYKYLEGNTTDSRTGKIRPYRLLVMGFLFDMDNQCEMLYVQPLEQTVREEWFRRVLSRYRHNNNNNKKIDKDHDDGKNKNDEYDEDAKEYDAIVVMAHIDYSSPLLTDIIHPAIRSAAGPDVPVQYVSGHSHIRAYATYDDNSASFEAGHYFDTVGYASFSLTYGGGNAHDDRKNSNKTNMTEAAAEAGPMFHHAFLDTNKRVLREALDGVTTTTTTNAKSESSDPSVRRTSSHDDDDDGDDLSTEAGRAMSELIRKTREELHLDDVVGCSDATYYLDEGFRDSNDEDAGDGAKPRPSLWQMYMEKALPHSVSMEDSVYLQGRNEIRFDLCEGEITVDDVVIAVPYYDVLYRIVTTTPTTIATKGNQTEMSAGDDTLAGSQLLRAIRWIRNKTDDDDAGKDEDDDFGNGRVIEIPESVALVSSVPVQSIRPGRRYALYTNDYELDRVLRMIRESLGGDDKDVLVDAVPIYRRRLERDVIHRNGREPIPGGPRQQDLPEGRRHENFLGGWFHHFGPRHHHHDDEGDDENNDHLHRIPDGRYYYDGGFRNKQRPEGFQNAFRTTTGILMDYIRDEWSCPPATHKSTPSSSSSSRANQLSSLSANAVAGGGPSETTTFVSSSLPATATAAANVVFSSVLFLPLAIATVVFIATRKQRRRQSGSRFQQGGQRRGGIDETGTTAGTFSDDGGGDDTPMTTPATATTTSTTTSNDEEGGILMSVPVSYGSVGGYAPSLS